ncbi:hypothetical protein QEG73_00365 [Chitinophagaceae bacterium 26-R-25]|nr:hypothetical protein [Chitinophagaceae bacterium 26-R-25]
MYNEAILLLVISYVHKIFPAPQLKKAASLLVLIISTAHAFSQDSPKTVARTKVIWTTPVSKNTNVNGLAVGIMAWPWMKADSLKISGLNIEISPFGLIGGIYGLWGTFVFRRDTTNAEAWASNRVFPEEDKFIETEIKGVSVSLGGLCGAANFSGTDINGFSCNANQMSGFELTGLMNLHYKFRGVMIAGLRNKVTTGNGVQIGLINTCKSGRVVQLGLINRIGKRIIPLINFSLNKS